MAIGIVTPAKGQLSATRPLKDEQGRPALYGSAAWDRAWKRRVAMETGWAPSKLSLELQRLKDRHPPPGSSTPVPPPAAPSRAADQAKSAVVAPSLQARPAPTRRGGVTPPETPSAYAQYALLAAIALGVILLLKRRR